jgi:hypothetical protein
MTFLVAFDCGRQSDNGGKLNLKTVKRKGYVSFNDTQPEEDYSGCDESLTYRKKCRFCRFGLITIKSNTKCHLLFIFITKKTC